MAGARADAVKVALYFIAAAFADAPLFLFATVECDDHVVLFPAAQRVVHKVAVRADPDTGRIPAQVDGEVLSLDDGAVDHMSRDPSLVADVLPAHRGLDAVGPYERNATVAVSDQRTLSGTIGFDTSTIAGVIDRLEARGLLLRNASPDDKRVRLLTLTQQGGELLDAVIPGMLQAQVRMIAPLTEKQRAEFMKALRILIKANNAVSRAPAQRDTGR